MTERIVPFHLFGLTGGIASGKSSVARRFKARGVPVIDADVLAREVVAPATEGLAAVVAAFGPSVVDAGGSLDRKALGALVFADPDKRRRLNAITHPRIAGLLVSRTADLQAAGEPLACYEAALLAENGLADAFRPLVVVAATERTQLARAMTRDGETEAAVRARIGAQMPLAAKVALADFVLDNEGSPEELERAADRILDAVCARLGVPIRARLLP